MQQILKDLLYERRYIFSSKYLRRKYNFNEIQAYRVLRRLVELGLIKKLWRGTYLVDEAFIRDIPYELVIDSFLRDQGYYFGLFHALSFWKLHDAIFQVHTVIVKNRALSGKRISILGRETQFIFISPKRFFGYVKAPYASSLIQISDREKTLLDTIYFLNKYSSFTDICKAFHMGLKKFKLEKLIKYAIRFESETLVQRLGYLLELFGVSDTKTLRAHIGKNYVPLNPKKPVEGFEKNPKWRIIVNDRCSI